MSNILDIYFYSPDANPVPWREALVDAATSAGYSARVHFHPDWPTEDSDTLKIACVWQAPPAILNKISGLAAIFSLGAGVDYITAATGLPDCPIYRLRDEDLAEDMADYIAMAALMLHRDIPGYIQQQSEKLFARKFYRRTRDTHVLLLGAGHLGAAAAARLSSIGFSVSTWGRTDKNAGAAAKHYAGAEGLKRALPQADIIAAILPHTDQTAGLMDKQFFENCKPGVKIVNAGRGSLIDEEALIAALESGQVAAAMLDVFKEEPLPPEHAFWRAPNLMITPHAAAITRADSAAAFILDQVKAIACGTPPAPLDKARGY